MTTIAQMLARNDGMKFRGMSGGGRGDDEKAWEHELYLRKKQAQADSARIRAANEEKIRKEKEKEKEKQKMIQEYLDGLKISENRARRRGPTGTDNLDEIDTDDIGLSF